MKPKEIKLLKQFETNITMNVLCIASINQKYIHIYIYYSLYVSKCQEVPKIQNTYCEDEQINYNI